MLKPIISIFLFVLFATSMIGQSKYSRVKIDLSTTDMSELGKLGIEIDHGSYIPGVHFVNDFSERELALINNAGIMNYVIIDDVKADYMANKNQPVHKFAGCGDEEFYEYDTPENYTYGSMGGYHTYDEMLAVLEDMHEKFPNLVTGINTVENIKTWDGNDIIWLKVSDNPEVDEDEPETLYTALHHAREPNSLSQMIFYLWYLLENYETDAQVKYLVDNTQMYFMPCLNPDGYKYNELTDPEGGGFWRKNRRPDLDPERVGVDLNRNYGYFWGFDNVGSNPDMASNTYRGPQGFSEPETQAVREFSIQHNFQIALNYHTHGNLLIHPWGYNDTPTLEDKLFKAMGESMTSENDFLIGTGTETVGYVVNGSSDDYLYGEDAEKDKIYSFTPEVGPRFWPQESEIDQLNKSSLEQNLVATNLLLNYYDVNVTNIDPITSESQGTFELNVVKAGLKEGSVSISILPHDPDLLSFDNPFITLSLTKTEKETLLLDYTISEDAPSLKEFNFDVLIDNGEFIDSKTYSFNFRKTISEEVLIDDFQDLNDWSTESTFWGLTTEDFVSAPLALTDSPFSNYENNEADAIRLTDQISLEDADFTTLKFSAKWELEYNYDYVVIQISNDNGGNWTSLCGNYTRPGVETHGTYEPLYDGTQVDWVVEEIDLSDYTGQIIKLRLKIISDQFIRRDGFYIDDIILENATFVTTVGTEDMTDANLFSVFPSLNNGTFDVEVDAKMVGEETYLEVYDVQGRLLEKRKVKSTIETIILQGPAKGIYIIKLVGKDGESSSKKVNVIR